MKIYVGNLSYDTMEEGLRNAFSPYGTVGDATVITDRETGRSRGFGFVEIADDTAAQAAIQALNGTAHRWPQCDGERGEAADRAATLERFPLLVTGRE